MTFATIEGSRDSGSLVELYEITLGSTRFLYTNAEREVSFGIDTFEPTPIRRGRVVSTIDAKDSQVDVSVPGSNVFARLYFGVIPGSLPEITIRQLHVTDPDEEAVFVFQGQVSTVSFTEDLSSASLACRPIVSAVGRLMLRHTFQGLCNHVLFDSRCTQDEADFEENVIVESVSNRILTVAASELSTEAAGYWEAGFIQFGEEYRSIVAQSGRVMTLDLPFLENPTSTTVRIVPGCDHLIDGDCLNTYGTGPDGNTINHGGYPYVPQYNLFEKGLTT